MKRMRCSTGPSRREPSWQRAAPRLKAFTLIELLIVMAIIGILLALLFPVFRKVQAKGRQAACENNLHTFGLAFIQYRSDHDGRMPPWLSDLYPDYCAAKGAYLCLSDRSRGREGSKPDLGAVRVVEQQFRETDDNANGDAYRDANSMTATNRNPEIAACSYMYEYCDVKCESFDWLSHLAVADGTVLDRDGNPAVTSWNEVKEWQLTHGDKHHPGKYNETEFPAVRCFHHWSERNIRALDWNSTDGKFDGTKTDQLTLNVSYMGNVYQAPIKWEEKMQ